MNGLFSTIQGTGNEWMVMWSSTGWRAGSIDLSWSPEQFHGQGMSGCLCTALGMQGMCRGCAVVTCSCGVIVIVVVPCAVVIAMHHPSTSLRHPAVSQCCRPFWRNMVICTKISLKNCGCQWINIKEIYGPLWISMPWMANGGGQLGAPYVATAHSLAIAPAYWIQGPHWSLSGTMGPTLQLPPAASIGKSTPVPASTSIPLHRYHLVLIFHFHGFAFLLHCTTSTLCFTHIL